MTTPMNNADPDVTDGQMCKQKVDCVLLFHSIIVPTILIISIS